MSKGRNYRGVAEMFREAWAKYANPMSIDVDVSKMDQSFTQEMMFLFHEFISSSSTDSEAMREFLMWTLNLKVRGVCGDASFQYEVPGTLSSGMPFTSLAGVCVVTGIVWLFKRHFSLDLTIVDAGDDMTIVFDRSDENVVLPNIAAWYQQFGLTLEVGAPNYHLEGIEFCQSHVCELKGGYQMVRNPISAAAKDSASLLPLRTPKEAAAWLEAVGRGGIASQGGAPIATARYRMMIRSSQSMVDKSRMSNRQKIRYAQLVNRSFERGGSYEWFGSGMDNSDEITDAARCSFERAFKISPHEQRAIESEYDKITLTFDEVRGGVSAALRAWDIVCAV